MSQFLPEGFGQTPPSGVAAITPPDPETTSADIALMQRVLSAASRNPNLIPTDFMAYLIDWIQTQRLQIPISQVPGFTQFTASIDAGQSVTVGNSGTNTAAGPSITGLSPGKYVLVAGFDGQTAFGNGTATLTTSPAALVVSGSQASITSVSKGTTLTLTSTTTITSTLSVTSGGSGTNAINGAWMIALKYANL